MERKSGRPVLEIGPALNFQAEIFAETDHVADAETCYRKALALDEKNYGLDSARVAKDLSGLAELLKARCIAFASGARDHRKSKAFKGRRGFKRKAVPGLALRDR